MTRMHGFFVMILGLTAAIPLRFRSITWCSFPHFAIGSFIAREGWAACDCLLSDIDPIFHLLRGANLPWACRIRAPDGLLTQNHISLIP